MATTITLRNFNSNELEYILKEQFKNRLLARENYSLENTVLKIVREHRNSKESNATDNNIPSLQDVADELKIGKINL